MAADVLNGAQLMGVLAQDTSRYLQKCQDLSGKTIITYISLAHSQAASSLLHSYNLLFPARIVTALT